MTTTTVSTTTAPVVKVGDFFSSSYGYDQTNVDFYRVVGVTASGKSVKVQKWTKAAVESHGSHDSMVPGEGPATYTEFPGATYEMSYWERQELAVTREMPVQTKRLRLGGYRDASFTVASYANAYLWDGTPQYQTGAGYGH